MLYEARAARVELGPFVRCLWRLRGARGEIEPQAIVPDGCFELIVHLGEPFVRHLVLFLLFPGLRDLIVLAVNAPQVAVAEKDLPGSPRAAQHRLLAKVCGIRRHDRQPPRIAGRDLVLQPVVAAILRADGARAKQFFKLLDPLGNEITTITTPESGVVLYYLSALSARQGDVLVYVAREA